MSRYEITSSLIISNDAVSRRRQAGKSGLYPKIQPEMLHSRTQGLIEEAKWVGPFAGAKRAAADTMNTLLTDLANTPEKPVATQPIQSSVN